MNSPTLRITLRNAAVKAEQRLQQPEADLLVIAEQLRQTAELVIAEIKEDQSKPSAGKERAASAPAAP